MKKYIFTVLSLIATICFTSCKDESDDNLITGTGGPLVGVWTMSDGNDFYYLEDGKTTGLLIGLDGRMKSMDIVASVATPKYDYAEGIITTISGNSFSYQAVDGVKSSSYVLDTIVREVNFKYEFCPRLYIAGAASDDVEVAEGSSLGGYYLMDYSLNPMLQQVAVEKDPALLGEWGQQFGDQSFDFSAVSSSKMNGAVLADWCTKNGLLYVLHTIAGVAKFQQVFNYTVNNGVLTVYSKETGTSIYTRSNTIQTGYSGELGGVWVKTGADCEIYSSSSGVIYGIDITADGNLYVSNTGGTSVTHLSSSPELLITGVMDGNFVGMTPEGTVSGTYVIDTTFAIAGGKMIVVEHLVLTSTYSFYLDSKGTSDYSFSGHYVRLKRTDGSVLSANAVNTDMVGTWSMDYFDNSYNLLTEKLIFYSDGTAKVNTYSSANRLLNTISCSWGSMQKQGCEYMRLKASDNSLDLTCQYTIISNTLYVNFNGEWGMYDKQ